MEAGPGGMPSRSKLPPPVPLASSPQTAVSPVAQSRPPQLAAPFKGEIRIMILTLPGAMSGATFTLENVESFTTVENLKALIHGEQGIPPALQRLIYAGRQV